MSETIPALTTRMREIFAQVVEAYLDSGQPVGSKYLSDRVQLSPASIRGVMSQLESQGLLTHPHTSAGRMPTELGLRLFVDGIMHARMPGRKTRETIQRELDDRGIEEMLDAATQTLSGLSSCAGVITAPTREMRLKQLSFVPLDSTRALAVLVGEGGEVENRILPLAAGMSPVALQEVANYASARLAGMTLSEAGKRLASEIEGHEQALDRAAGKLVASGLAEWRRDGEERPVLIVRGQANLLDDTAADDLERVRQLLDELENRQEIARLLGAARDAEGCRIFIGSENRMFALSGSSVIAAPYRGSDGKVIGVVGVIGPTRLNYARVVPMVDFTAEALTRRMQ